MYMTSMAAAVFQADAAGSNNARLLMIFIGIAALALLAQALVMVVLAVGAMKMQKQVVEQIDEIKAKVLPLIDKSNVLVTELTPQIQQIAMRANAITSHVQEISGVVRDKVNEFGPTVSAANQTVRQANETVRDANRKTQAQIVRVNGMVTSVLDATALAGKAIQRGIEVPVRQASNLLDAVSAAFASFMKSRAKPRPYRPPVGTYQPPRDRDS